MSEAVEKLKPLVEALTIDERDELASYIDTLFQGGDPDAADDLDPADIEEINRRVEDARSGRVKGIPAEEVMRQLREKYG